MDEHSRYAANWNRIFTSSPPRRAEEPKRASRDALPPVGNAATGELEKLKGLSLRQPWAEQVMRGAKTVEYRQSAVKYRGRVYIYASLSRFSAEDEAEFASEVGYPLDELPRGVVVGTVEITDCYEEERGLFAWELKNPQRLTPPVAPIERPQPIWFHPFGKPAR